MKTAKAIKKIFVVLLITIFVVVVSSILSTFLFKDQLINQFIREANKQLNTPISIGKISVSALDNFPRMTLNFDDVYIEESFAKSSYPLIEAKKIAFTFNPLEIYRGNYNVEQIHITNAKCHFKVNKEGEPNYIIFKKGSSASENQKVKLNLSKITLSHVNFKYANDNSEVYLEVETEKTKADVDIIGQIYNVTANGDYLLKTLQSQQTMLMKNKEMSVEAALTYDDENKHIDFKKSQLNIKGSNFITYGNYDFLNTPEITFYVEGKDTDLQTLVSLLPDEQIESLKKYQSKGGVYFDLSLKGKIDAPIAPALQVNFGLINAEILYPDKNIKITNATTEGIFSANCITELNKGQLELRNIGGMLENKKFSSNLLLRNFDDLFLKMDFDGSISVNSLINFLDVKTMNHADGQLQVNLTMNGHINDLKKKATASKVKTSGEINVSGLSFHHNNFELPFENINGNLLFNNNDLAISDVKGYYGSSDFLLNGFFKNIIAFILFKDEPVGIEADLRSRYINLDELLAHGASSAAGPGNYSFRISPRLMLKFNCDVDKLKFRRFKPKNIKGDLKIKNQVAFTDKLQFNAMGGKIALSGIVDATDTTAFEVNSSFSVNNVNIDSIFYVFENFNQSFLEDKHLRGKILADVNTEMTLNEKLRLKPATLTASINTSIIGGELNNFEPMQRLANYVDEDKLDHLVFSELRNEIQVKDQTIYLPQMEVSSNITDIKISGTHTFDQKIDYRVIAPLRSKEKIDKDAAFGAIEEDTRGRSMLYLKIIGTTDDYKIVYDKEGVKHKIVSDLKKEAGELKKAFKNKGLDKKKTLELEEDDYFDWDDDGDQ